MENWEPSNDDALRKMEVEVHEALHGSRAEQVDLQVLFKNPRLKLFPVMEQIIGSSIRGKVLDIGCGSGFSSAWLAKYREVETIHALEVTRSAVERLIPEVLSQAEIPEGKVVPTLGSFNAIPRTDEFDFIVSFGAIHHSASLLTTLRECYKALRPGGYMLCQEPVSSDFVKNHSFVEQYESTEFFDGVGLVKKGDRDDHFFRECEYKIASHFAGFELIAFQSCYFRLHPLYTRNGLKKLLLDRLRQRNSRFPAPKPHIIIIRKPNAPPKYIPHLWRSLIT